MRLEVMDMYLFIVESKNKIFCGCMINISVACN
jgi:hypothetical protein